MFKYASVLVFVLIYILAIPLYSNAVTFNVNSASTLNSAISNSNPGDTIIIANGTYNNFGHIIIPHTSDCTQANPCTIVAETNGSVVFSGQGALNLDIRAKYWIIKNIKWQNQTGFGPFTDPVASASGPIIVFDGAQNSTIDGAHIVNIQGNGPAIAVMRHLGTRDSTNNAFINSTIDGVTQASSGFTVFYVASRSSRGLNNSGFRIEGNTFKNRTTTGGGSGTRYWIRCGNSTNSAWVNGNNISGNPINKNLIIKGNTFRDDTLTGCYDVYHLKCSHARVENNVFTNVGRLAFRQGDNNKFIGNKIINPITQCTGVSFWSGGHGQLIANNVFYTNSGSSRAIQISKGNTDVNGDGKWDYKAFNGDIYNNTFLGFSTAGIRTDGNSNGNLDGVTTVNPTITAFKNNVFKQQNGTIITGSSCASIVQSANNNAWSGSATAGCITQSGAGDVLTDPQFTNESIGDLSLKDTSPLINAGVVIAGVPETNLDIDLNQRDNQPDIGAYEWNSTPPPAGSCDSVFGGVASYLLCEETETTCKFNALLSGSTCDALCASFGKTCVGAFDNPTGSCTELGVDTCSTVRSDEICVCELQDSPPEPPTVKTFYIDSSCGTQGNGTTTTCGANGPWNSIRYAMQTVDCAGMSPGDILEIRGMTSAPNAGNWYDLQFFEEERTLIDSACSGITIKGYSGATEYVVMDGSIDISNSANWVSIGSNVYECVSCGDQTTNGFIPHRAYYQISAGAEQELDLTHTVQTCSTSLPAGDMTFNPITNSICVHLHSNEDPTTADYFRIPHRGGAFSFNGEDVDDITIDSSGSSKIYMVRYARNAINLSASMNQNITIDGVTFWDILENAINTDGLQGIANYNFSNNTFDQIGEVGIKWTGDLGVASITGNTFTNGGGSNFQDCDGTGAGCHAGFDYPPTGILVTNCPVNDRITKGTIRYNTFTGFGDGYGGAPASGIRLDDCAHANIVDANLFTTSAALAGFNAIYLTGIGAGKYIDWNIITNNRCKEVDTCFHVKYDTETSQVGFANFFYGNTSYNQNAWGWKQDINGKDIGGSLWFKCNLCVSDDGDGPTCLSVPASTLWNTANFEGNGFECSHAGSCSNANIAIFQGNNYKRDGDCTPLTDCIADINANNNIYSSDFQLNTSSLDIVSGSDAEDACVNLTLLTTDYKNPPTSRPKGSTTDIGAHEFDPVSPSNNLTQTSFIFCNRMQKDCKEFLGAENEDVELYDNAQFNIRFAITGDTGTQSHQADFALHYQHCNPTCGSWIEISPLCTGEPVCLIDDPNQGDGDSITNKLSLGSRIFSSNSSFYDTVEDGIQAIMAGGEQLELEFFAGFCDNDGNCGTISQGDSLNLRVQYADGSLLNTYTVADATVTVGNIRGIILQSQ